MLRSELPRLIRRFLILVVLAACLSVASFAPAGQAAMIPCCSACDACYDNCDINNPTPACYNQCFNMCRHGCSEGC